MSEKKYSSHISPAPIMMVPPEDGANSDGYKYLSVFAHRGELKTNHTLGFHYMTETYEDVYPHTHEGSEILCLDGQYYSNDLGVSLERVSPMEFLNA